MFAIFSKSVAIKKVDLPNKNGGSFHSYVSYLLNIYWNDEKSDGSQHVDLVDRATAFAAIGSPRQDATRASKGMEILGGHHRCLHVDKGGIEWA
jgi:hypothetical protein